MNSYDPTILGGDESRFWSSAAGAYVEDLPEGAGVTRIASESELDDVLAIYGLLGPTARRLVRKSTITARLIDAGKMQDAHAALMANPINFARWIAADRPATLFRRSRRCGSADGNRSRRRGGDGGLTSARAKEDKH